MSEQLRNEGNLVPGHMGLAGERLEKIANRLAQYAVRYDLMHDSRAIFTRTYSMMTKLIDRSLPAINWQDAEWIIELAEKFSGRYFQALDSYDADLLAPGAWLHAFATFARRRLSALEVLVCGMACHIIHDLPLSLGDVGFQDNSPNSHIGDYHLMNGVLDTAIGPILRAISRTYNPALSIVEVFGIRNEELLTGYGISLSRAAAWYNACRLRAPSDTARQSIEKSPQVFVDAIVRPRLISLDAVVRLFRWIVSFGVRWPECMPAIQQLPRQDAANRNYYFHIGAGNWSGSFTFRLTSLNAFFHDHLSFKNRFLVIGMTLLMTLLRRARIDSVLRTFPDQGANGIAFNLVRISACGVTLYLLRETYTMLADGSGVFVQSNQRFGPFPFLLNSKMRYRAKVDEPGTHTVYYLPLLGTNWIGDYTVSEDEHGLSSVLTCSWGHAEEHVRKIS